jgi:hypothetical protein
VEESISKERIAAPGDAKEMRQKMLPLSEQSKVPHLPGELRRRLPRNRCCKISRQSAQVHESSRSRILSLQPKM